MKTNSLILGLLLGIGLTLSSCRSEVAETPEPTAIPSTEVPSTNAPSLEPGPSSTSTSTPEPSSTSTPEPLKPDNLPAINYRTISRLKKLVTYQYPDVIDLEFSPDDRYLRLRVNLEEDTHRDTFLDLTTGLEILSLEGGQRTYFSPDRTSVFALDGKDLAIYDLQRGVKMAQYNSRYQVAALSPDNRLLVEIEEIEPGTGTTFRVVDLTTDEEQYRIFVNGDLERDSLQFDPEGKYLIGISLVPPDTHLTTIWRVENGQVVRSLFGYQEAILHPFHSEVAASSAKQSYISLISTVTWEQKRYLGPALDGPGFHDIKYTSAGRLIYGLFDGETTAAWFWYPPSGELLENNLDLDLLAISVSPDSRLLGTSDKQGNITIWGVSE